VIEAEFVNEITANQKLISPVPLCSHGRITSNPPPGLVIPTKGYIMTGQWATVFYALLIAMYPWVR
jgi:hypothetical protein